MCVHRHASFSLVLSRRLHEHCDSARYADETHGRHSADCTVNTNTGALDQANALSTVWLLPLSSVISKQSYTNSYNRAVTTSTTPHLAALLCV
jgi:hypothetical protein